jgi:hypothetical protein
MKYFFTAALILSSLLGYAQSSAKNSVRSFLSDLKTTNWTFEKMYEDHMQFMIDSLKYNKDLITVNTLKMQSMADELKARNLDISKLIIKREGKPKKKQRSNVVSDKWDPDPSPLTHKVYNSDKNFLWYFLLTEDHKIRAIIRFKENKLFFVVSL